LLLGPRVYIHHSAVFEAHDRGAARLAAFPRIAKLRILTPGLTIFLVPISW